jgi:hypothetical protein
MMLTNALRLLYVACLESVTVVRRPERVAAEEESLGGQVQQPHEALLQDRGVQ